jgi:hypothetical protein
MQISVSVKVGNLLDAFLAKDLTKIGIIGHFEGGGAVRGAS